MLDPLSAQDPRHIGPYQTLARLGAGGMGMVYLARRDGPPPDPREDGSGLAAVKTMHRELAADEGFRVRFRRETEAARTVRSPGTVRLLDAGPQDDPPWLATAYLPAPSLQEAVSRLGPLPEPLVRRLGADLARALAAVHGARLVHRDLKPGNVLLAADGPRVIDFGIAREADATALTATGVALGSPGYMAPEQLGGAALTPATDVFGLGAVLCFAATGHGPFEDEQMAAVLMRAMRGEAELSAVPDGLRGLLAACLRPDPGQRPRTEELIRELDGIPADHPAGVAVPAAPAGRPDPPWPKGVRELIGEHRAALARALERAPAPPSAVATMTGPPRPQPAPASAPGPAAPPAAPSAAPSAGRRRRAVVAATAGGAALALTGGVLAGVLLFGGDGGGDPAAGPDRTPGAAGDDPADGTGGAAKTPPEDDGAPGGAGPVRAAEFSHNTLEGQPRTDYLGEAATDPELRPENWEPWWNTLPGFPESCFLGEELISCRVNVGGTHSELRVLSTADGGELLTAPKWRELPVPLAAPAVSGPYVYLPDGTDVRRVHAADGTVAGAYPGSPGYYPERTLVADGVVYAGFVGESGIGNSYSMLFRAFEEETGELLWERNVTAAHPYAMELAGGRLLLEGDMPGAVLDAATGEPVAEAAGACGFWRVVGELVYCPDYGTGQAERPVWSAATWEEVYRLPPLSAVLDPERGIVADTADPQLRIREGASGEQLWAGAATDFATRVQFTAGGGLLLASGYGGLDIYRLSDGTPLPEPELPAGWPGPARGGTPNDPVALARGGLLFLFFQNGDVISTELPQ
ncbi:serine/threonine-protein kinase [Streptomyces aidingensis]|uniref:Serine/threonine protein kinase n=1 Tax=Streptomyces aidingensis TaxID=910347 RepID=A0A1I1QCD9_9ACTN|nr:serine/threonine-protein kinase [Streptomyces aidingensis]SFD16893.1 Serine/threonine protein kinase [Streptomyces aidingensis]